MKKVFWIKLALLAWVFSFSSMGLADTGGHEHHVKHNMVLFGEGEVFVSHIVYKEPHNYQVILKLHLDPAIREKYLAERAKHAKDQFIYLLDPMNIEGIATAPSISGKILRYDEAGTAIEIVPHLDVMNKNFEVIYFDELPLSLSR